jgi:hypothetical protein
VEVVGVRREWEPEDLIAAWTLLDSDWDLIKNKAEATRLGFCLLLKFFEQEARFPRHVGELPKAAVGYVAGQVKVDPALLAELDRVTARQPRRQAQSRRPSRQLSITCRFLPLLPQAPIIDIM